MENLFIITGANRGLGEAFVDLLIRNKNNFIISISRSQSKQQEKYKSDNFYFLKADLSQNSLEEKLYDLKEDFAGNKIFFINNASIIEPITNVENLSEVDIDRIISVNVKAPILIVKYLLKNFSEKKLSFVNISSGAANRPINNWSMYCATKSCIKMFFNVAEQEYNQHSFFNIDPGVMDTNMQESIRKNDFPDADNFRALYNERKLRSPNDVAIEILNDVL